MWDLSPDLLQQLCEAVKPHLRKPADRKWILDMALIDSLVRDQIDESGDATQFANEVVTTLFDFGTLDTEELALCALLRVIRDQRVGTNRRPRYDCLIDAVNDLEFGGPDRTFEEAVFAQLDYTTQTEAFENVVQGNRVCGFLVNGGPEDGHHILINRFIRRFSQHVPIIKVRFRQSSHGVDILSVWKQIHREIRRGNLGRVQQGKLESIKRQVISSVRTQLKSRHVIFLFDEAEVLPDSRHQTFLDELWRPLVDGVQQQPLPDSDKLLLVFVTDFGTEVRSSFPAAVERLGQPWGPRMLPRLLPLNEDILQSWIDNNLRRTDLNEDVVQDLEEAVAEIMDQTNGVPIETIRKICDVYRFGFFDDKEALWQIH